MAHRKSWAERTKQNTRGASVLYRAFNEKPEFVETREGDLVRVWAKDDWRHMTNDDVSKALRGQRAFDETDLLLWLPPQTIKDAITRQWLARPGASGPWFVTKKARDDLGLPNRGFKFYEPPRR